MKFQNLIAITILIALAGAEEQESESNLLDEFRQKKKDQAYFAIPWSIPDFVVGLAIGTYGSLNSRARDGDCFSQWYDWSFAAMELSNYFTKAFDSKDW